MDLRLDERKRRNELRRQKRIERQWKSARDNFASDLCNHLKDSLLCLTLDLLAGEREKFNS